MLSNDFRLYQFALARHLRDPLGVPAPDGVSAPAVLACTQEMAHNLNELLMPAFANTRAVLGEDLWQHTLRLFLHDAPTHAPWATSVQEVYVKFLGHNTLVQHLPPWLEDLAHFEWLQSAVAAADVVWPAHDPHGDVLQKVVVMNPTHVEVMYDWSVQRINLTHKPFEMQSTYLSIVRDVRDKVCITESSRFRRHLIDLLRQGQTGAQAFKALADWLEHPDVAAFTQEGLPVLKQLQREGVVLGTQP
jgi:hypothetical protein